jgi:hypothetical protein
MPRYFLHLRDGTDQLLDEEGIEYIDMEALRRAVMSSARDLICGEITSDGLLDLRFWIDAEDESGKIVYTLPFKHALIIIPQE